jgi:glycosyltransferase involved in cell wall biosynthesis
VTGPVQALEGRRIVLDCRWLGLGGAGRVTELLLRELQASPPPGDWVLWGPPTRLAPFAFPRAAVVAGDRPLRLGGQRDLARVPRGDVTVYLHQIRPLRPGRSVTVIHDTIPLRHGGTRASRFAKRMFFRATARLSTHVLTDSKLSRERIVHDLGVPPERISVMTFPQDMERARRVAGLRATLGQEDRLLYVGRFAPHKNLARLGRAFATTRFAREGGTLLLVGGSDDEAERLQARSLPGVEARGECSEEELDRLLATSRALVLGSLEEGFGLPAFEAVASGLPVAVSRTGALTGLPPERASFFDPLDETGMAAAIDVATAREASAPVELDGHLAEVVLDALARVLVKH